jgi:anti-sigma regulatory factor (Ser/Thr protein kinase)
MAVCVARRFELDPTSDAPAHARRLVCSELADLLAAAPGVSDTLSDVELVVSELVSNAVKATVQPITLGIQVHHKWLGMSVHDDEPAEPVLLDPAPGDTHGRGLQIVSALAREWGVRPEPGDGKTVWVRLALPAGSSEAFDCLEPSEEEWPD